ncbi:MAG: glycoside hydrolase family 3 C-terminal domain-containing protein [Candidatus Marinimicrobia bacterium]|nr:glycoside hydrolase family 3 C-terminal domain-containing protein [Candidatus Neomarinimicrobiota bacterium]MCF7828294.1 glycoside hydrolase family 3 C-terminal domain-containing protein [Candidatus Neomarinimicrobiota bacterium]MCF7879531.1 glycoside hydrolase family 3 C-terminal domain-containing protein [Candidatus Neomarinimicrobiota bacterium]
MNKPISGNLLRLFLIFIVTVPLLAQTPQEQQVESLLRQMTLQEKLEYIGGYKGFYIRGIDRLDLPEIKMSDGPLGVRNYGPTTAYPASIGLAASWNRELAKSFGEAMGRDARARGVHIILAPGVNIYRAAMCGRNFEYLGEDPYLASQMVVPVIRGIQSREVVATVKHYIANNQEFDRHNVSSNVDERTLREIYMPAFKAAVQEGDVGALMTAYNLINGTHASEHNYLINDVLKDEWGFNGLVMSDWVSTYSTLGTVNGGLDLEMPSGKFMHPDSIQRLMNEGKIRESTIDEKVRRIILMIVRFNFMERDQELSSISKDDPESKKVALQMAREATVLLKNDGGLLPLEKDNLTRLAVIGPNAHPLIHGGSGSSYTTPAHTVSILDGIQNIAGEDVEIVYKRGINDKSGTRTYGKSTFSLADGTIGLRGQYWDNQEFRGNPSLERIDKQVNFVFNEHPLGGDDNSDFSVKWSGQINPKESGNHRFYVTGDDGYRLILNGDTLLNAWIDQAPTARSAVYAMESGETYDVVLEYYQNGGGAEIRFGYEQEQVEEIDDAVKVAVNADAVILCVGFSPNTEGEGRDRPYNLPEDQLELIHKTLAANENTVVVLNAGGNVGMDTWIGDAPALLHAWYPGQEGGTALAEILFGAVNPSGKLPASFEAKWEDSPVYDSYYDEDGDKAVKYSEGIFLGYRHFDRVDTTPRFPFGYGLSYTTFEYDDLHFDVEIEGDVPFAIAYFTVTNTGETAGAEVAQIYVSDLESSVRRPVKELKGFEKVYLNPGESKNVEIMLDTDAFQYYDVNNKTWTLEPGEFDIRVGRSSENIILREKITI